MKQEVITTHELPYVPCRYGESPTLFRGPRKRLDAPYIACIGGADTYGRFIERPYPMLVERALGKTCVNFGVVDGGVDMILQDEAVLDICRKAETAVIQITGAQNISNRFYKVHPRRNDRFMGPSSVLKAIYRDVDFSVFSTNRQMLGALFANSPDRFETVVIELRTAWLARMKTLIDRIGQHCVLLWFADHLPTEKPWVALGDQLHADPLFVTRAMIEELRPLVREIVMVRPSAAALGRGTAGMYFEPDQLRQAAELLGPDCHVEAAEALTPVLGRAA